jgi:integrase
MRLLALKWSDFDFKNSIVMVQRGVVHGRVSSVKMEYSEDELPLDAFFVARLIDWRAVAPKSDEYWVFSNPRTGTPYHAEPIQQVYLAPVGRSIGLRFSVGWHTLRHSYRSLLDAAGAPVGVQQKLMRHAQISTTMNEYGNAYLSDKRTANSNVVGLIFAQKTDRPAASN